jgi:hypothetical protein
MEQRKILIGNAEDNLEINSPNLQPLNNRTIGTIYEYSWKILITLLSLWKFREEGIFEAKEKFR